MLRGVTASSDQDVERAVELDVVICTYDNAAWLERVFERLAAQVAAPDGWRVLVVDNNSSDDTAAVVERHRASGRIPGLRRILETQQGLTPARLRGVRETDAPWLAFVDDDCLLDAGWIAGALAFARAHPDAAGFGGRVEPTYLEAPPEVLDSRGWAFAEQIAGEEVAPLDCLVGAGMVVNRAALLASGWVDQPYFDDRIGRRLVSGGDVELALRLAGTGRPLWYVPECRIEHVIPPNRTEQRYLVRLCRGLGVSTSMSHALLWRGGARQWPRAIARDLRGSLRDAARSVLRAARRRTSWADCSLVLAYESGRWLGALRVLADLTRGRPPYLGGVVPSGRAVRAG